MAAVPAILMLSSVFILSTSYVLLDDDENLGETLTMMSEYKIKAERIDLLNAEKLPMELWYSEEYNRSRADVYHGMVRRYFYWSDDGASGQDGDVYMMYPKTTENERNMLTCVMTDMKEQTPSDAFPNNSFDDAVYLGNTEHEGQEVDKWELSTEESHVILYTTRTERGVDVPVQIIKKDFDKMKGTISAHVIFNYYNYNPVVDEDELDAEKDEACQVVADDFHGQMQVLHPAFHEDLEVAFNSFKKHHNTKYKNKKEHDMRREIFHKNWKLVMDYNRQNLGFKLALNHFSDLTPSERRHRTGGRRSDRPSGTIAFPHSDEEVKELVTQVPDEYDMRLEGVISPVKNQGDCGSCWTFGTAAAVEGALARLDGRILDLSEQSIVDCSWEDDNTGCDGGWPKVALQHIIKHGLPLDEDYGGYLGQNGFCHIENATEVFRIRGFTLVTPRSASAMKVALFKHGPVVVTMQVSDVFYSYASGVFYDNTCKDLSNPHAVAVVGYGVRDGVSYWILKNSWGEDWGEDGYMLISAFDNNCFVLDEPYYAVV